MFLSKSNISYRYPSTVIDFNYPSRFFKAFL